VVIRTPGHGEVSGGFEAGGINGIHRNRGRKGNPPCRGAWTLFAVGATAARCRSAPGRARKRGTARPVAIDLFPTQFCCPEDLNVAGNRGNQRLRHAKNAPHLLL
jgi:hypothetical protein